MRFLLVFLLPLSALHAQNSPVKVVTGKRVALVIGNDAYARNPLNNCVGDARAIARLLREQLKFDIVLADTECENAKRLPLMRRVQSFQQQARDAAVALFYYAGHGMEDFDGRDNFLLPVDADLAEAAKDNAGLQAQGMPLDFVLEAMRQATSGAKIILLDCCRERPADRAVTTREGGGFVMPVDGAMPQDTLIMIAAAPARTASDGEQHGPFTGALIKHLPTPGTSLLRTFRDVRDEVFRVTHEQQKPWLKFDGSGDFFFDHSMVAGSAPPPPAAPAPLPPSQSSPPTPLPAPVPADTVQLPPSGYFSIQDLFARSDYSHHNDYSKASILRKVQTVLQEEGLYKGTPDGAPGRLTQQALIEWQHRKNLPVSGRLSPECLRQMDLTGLTERMPVAAPPPRVEAGGRPAPPAITRRPVEPGNELISLGGGRYLSPYARDRPAFNFPGYESGTAVRCPHTGRVCRIP